MQAGWDRRRPVMSEFPIFAKIGSWLVRLAAQAPNQEYGAVDIRVGATTEIQAPLSRGPLGHHLRKLSSRGRRDQQRDRHVTGERSDQSSLAITKKIR